MKILLTFVALIAFFAVTSCGPEAITEEQVLITYPDSGTYGVNILDTGNAIKNGSDFSFAAKIPEKGSLSVRITKISSANWNVDESTVSNWAISAYDPVSKSQTFTATQVSGTSDVYVELQPGEYELEYYENDDSNPTFTYTLEI